MKKTIKQPLASEIHVIEALRREHTESDDRRRKREREFCHGFFDADRCAREEEETEQVIAESSAWRETLFVNPHFLKAVEAIPAKDRAEDAKALIVWLRIGLYTFEAPPRKLGQKKNPLPLSMAIDTKKFAKHLRETVSSEEGKAITALVESLALAHRCIAKHEGRVTEEITPRPSVQEWNPKHAGAGGGRNKTAEATEETRKHGMLQAWYIRELAMRLPQNLRFDTALVRGLLAVTGLTDLNSNDVDSALRSLKKSLKKEGMDTLDKIIRNKLR